MSRQGRVEQLTREKPARVREHNEGNAELASLGLVHREAVGKLERVLPFISEFTWPESVLWSELTSELDLDLAWKTLKCLRLVLADNHADITVGQECFAFGFRPDVMATLVHNVDHLVAV